MDTHIVGTFFELVSEAHDASDAVDLFDLHPADPESVAAFETLQREQEEAALALVDHVASHGQRLRASIMALRLGDGA